MAASSSSDEDEGLPEDEGFSSPHILRVHVHSARGLAPSAPPMFGLATSAPVVLAVLGDEQRETTAAAIPTSATGANPVCERPREVVWGATCEGEVLEFDFDTRSPEVLSLQVWTKGMLADQLLGRCSLPTGPFKDRVLRAAEPPTPVVADGSVVSEAEQDAAFLARALNSGVLEEFGVAAGGATWCQLDTGVELYVDVQLARTPWRKLRDATAVEEDEEGVLLNSLRRFSQGVGQAGTRLSTLLLYPLSESPSETDAAPPAAARAQLPAAPRDSSAWTLKIRVCSASDVMDTHVAGLSAAQMPYVVGKAGDQRCCTGAAEGGTDPEWPAERRSFFEFEFDDDMPLKLKLKFTVFSKNIFQDQVLGLCAVDIAALRTEIEAATVGLDTVELQRSFGLNPTGQLHCMLAIS